MRFHHITEQGKTANEHANLILNNCEKFLRYHQPLYRGIPISVEFDKVKTNRDRIPTHSSYDLTEALNKSYEMAGSSVSRNECVFTTNLTVQAMDYGNLYYVFPIGDFEVLWNTEMSDAYDYFDQAGMSLTYKSFPSNTPKYILEKYERGDNRTKAHIIRDYAVFDAEKIHEKLGKYYNNDLSKIGTYEGEVLIDVEEYYLVSGRYFDYQLSDYIEI